jgi:hypothetical protein
LPTGKFEAMRDEEWTKKEQLGLLVLALTIAFVAGGAVVWWLL